MRDASHGDEMNDPWEATALRCFRREEKRRQARRKALKRQTGGSDADSGKAEEIGCVLAPAKFAGLWLLFGLVLGLGGGPGLLWASGTMVLLRFLPPRLRVASRLKAYRDGRPEAVLDVYRFAADEFRAEIRRHRTRTLGSESEWAAARSALARASDEAERSVGYWRNRLRQEPSDPVIARQSRAATELNAKLRSALGKLDARADVLRKFFNECEAKVAVMDRHNRDIEESRRLDRLSGTADIVIAEAETTLTAIGASFLREARKVGEVLGDFERLQLKTLAGETSLDDIEVLADRINEASESNYATVEKLSRAIEGLGEPLAVRG